MTAGQTIRHSYCKGKEVCQFPEPKGVLAGSVARHRAKNKTEEKNNLKHQPEVLAGEAPRWREGWLRFPFQLSCSFGPLAASAFPAQAFPRLGLSFARVNYCPE
jgi:hypothetical protein